MKKIISLLEEKIVEAFSRCGYDSIYGRVAVSDRPDLCDYQCNGALAAAKQYRKSPMMIANEVVEHIDNKDNM